MQPVVTGVPSGAGTDSDGPACQCTDHPFPGQWYPPEEAAFSGYCSSAGSGGPTLSWSHGSVSCVHPHSMLGPPMFSALRRTWLPGDSRKAQGGRSRCRCRHGVLGLLQGLAGSGFWVCLLSSGQPGLWAACWVRTPESPPGPPPCEQSSRSPSDSLPPTGSSVRLAVCSWVGISGPLQPLLSIQTPQEETRGQLSSALSLRGQREGGRLGGFKASAVLLAFQSPRCSAAFPATRRWRWVPMCSCHAAHRASPNPPSPGTRYRGGRGHRVVGGLQGNFQIMGPRGKMCCCPQ